jgi:hypothetical protein
MKLLTVFALGGIVVLASALAIRNRSKLVDSDVNFGEPARTGKSEAHANCADQLDEAAFWKRLSLKNSICIGLVEGEITLETAAAQFQFVNTDHGRSAVALNISYPDLSPEEAIYRNVIDYAKSIYRKSRNFAAIEQRLEQEFERCRDKNFPMLAPSAPGQPPVS